MWQLCDGSTGGVYAAAGRGRRASAGESGADQVTRPTREMKQEVSKGMPEQSRRSGRPRRSGRERGAGRDDLSQAAAIARELFGVEGEATPLPGEFDLNFRIRRRPVGSAARARPGATADGGAPRPGNDRDRPRGVPIESTGLGRGGVSGAPGKSGSGTGNRIPHGDIVLKISPPSRRPALDLAASLLRHLEPAALSAEVPRPLVPREPVPQAPVPHEPAPPSRGPDSPTRTVRFRGQPHLAGAVTWVPGVPLATLRAPAMTVLSQLGRLLAELDRALADFDHPGLDRDFSWRMETAPATIRAHLPDLAHGRNLVTATVQRALRRLDPVRPELPRCPIHNDANDYNVLVTPSLEGARLAGLIDFGDAVRGWRVTEIAVAATYAMLELADPVEAACAVVRGYASVAPPTAAECRAVIPLVALRLCLSVCVQAREMARQPGNAYLAVSQKGAWQLLARLARSDWRLAGFRIREAAGRVPNPATAAVERWIRGAPERSPVMPPELLARPVTVDLSVENPDLPWPVGVGGGSAAAAGTVEESARDRGAGAATGDAGAGGALVRWVEERMALARATVGVGRWGEARLLYDAPGFGEQGNQGAEARTIHLGLDLFAPEGTPIRAPLAGEVVAVADNDLPRDYGPTVILRHAAETTVEDCRATSPCERRPADAASHPADAIPPTKAPTFHTLYGHLDRATLGHLVPGQRVRPGQVIGWLGGAAVNGGWPPHLHLQVVALDALADDGIADAEAEPAGTAGAPRSARHSPGNRSGSTNSASVSPANFPGVALERLRSVWEGVLPDPSPLSGLDAATATAIAPTDRPAARKAELATRRRARMGPSLSLSYRNPLHIVRGHGAWLYDAAGRGYLDTVNNVAHVGHGNPRVAEAIARQSRILNTNTRYLHEEIVALADELLAHFPEPADDEPEPAGDESGRTGAHKSGSGKSGAGKSGAHKSGASTPDPLEVVFLVCSGSEANELALRMARCHTGHEGVVCVEGGYHGNTTGLVHVSQYKFDGPGGRGVGPAVAVAAMPDPYRGKFRGRGGRQVAGRVGMAGSWGASTPTR